MLNIIMLTVGLGLASANTFGSHPLAPCEAHLDSKSIRRLEKAITRILPNGDGPLKFERKRLTGLVVAYVAGYVRALDPARIRQFYEVLERARTGSTTVTQDGYVIERTDADVALGYDDVEGLYLHVGKSFGQSLISYLQLIHELSHLKRAVSGADTTAEQIEHFKAVTLRWMGIYREEVAAAKDEYRFLHWAYPEGMILKVERATLVPRSRQEDYGNQKFLTYARAARAKTKREYVRAAVPLSDYQDDQRHFALERRRAKVIAQVKNVSPWLAKTFDALTREALHRVERLPLMTKDSSSR